MIDLKFFGRGAGFNPREGNTNAYLVRGENLLLIDCGESTFSRAFIHPGLTGWNSITVLLTHLHADHSGSLASFCSYNFYVLKRKVVIVHPLPTVTELLRLQGIGCEVYDYTEDLPANLGLFVEVRRVRHVNDMECFGYILRDEDEAIYYSGDSAEFPAEIAQALSEGKLARVYHDIASYPSLTHCPIDQAEAAVSTALRSRVFAMHLDSDCEQEFRSRGFSVAEVNNSATQFSIQR